MAGLFLDRASELEALLLDCSDIADATQSIFAFLDDFHVNIQDILPLIFYYSYIRPAKVEHYRELIYNLANCTPSRLLTTSISQSDAFFQFCNQDHKVLNSTSKNNITINQYIPSPDSLAYFIVYDDNQEIINHIDSLFDPKEQIPGFNNLFDYVCFCGSEQTFNLICQYYDPLPISVNSIRYALINGNIAIINFLREKQEHLFQPAFCSEAAIAGHNYNLVDENYSPKAEDAIQYFSSLALSKLTIFQDYFVLDIFHFEAPLLEHLIKLRGLSYISNANLIHPFILACILGDKNFAIQNQIPFSKYRNDFHFLYDFNSCYCNATLRFLFSLEDVQRCDFLHSDDDTIPTSCEFHLALIQFYIRDNYQHLRSTHLRFYLQEDCHMPFNTQNDLLEFFQYLLDRCLFLNQLFVSKCEIINFTNYFTTEETQKEKRKKYSNFIEIESRVLQSMQYLDFPGDTFSSSWIIPSNPPHYTHISRPPYLAKTSEAFFILQYHQYLVISFMKPHLCDNLTVYGNKLNCIGCFKYTGNGRSGHYIYIEKNDACFTCFDDMQTSPNVSTKCDPMENILIYKVEHPEQKLSTVKIDTTVNMDWELSDAATQEFHKFVSANVDLIRCPNLSDSTFLTRIITNNFDSSFVENNSAKLFEIYNEYHQFNRKAFHRRCSEIILKKFHIFFKLFNDSFYPTPTPHFELVHVTSKPYIKQSANRNDTEGKAIIPLKTNSSFDLHQTIQNKEPKPKKLFQIDADDDLLTRQKHMTFYFRSLYANTKKVVQQLQNKIDDLETKLQQNFENLSIGPTFKRLFDIAKRNSGKSNGANYTDEEKSFCMQIFLENKAAYKFFLAKGMKIPSLKTITRELKQFYKNAPLDNFQAIYPDNQKLLKTDIHHIFEFWQRVRIEKPKTPCIISIDAIIVSSRVSFIDSQYKGLIHTNLMSDEHKSILNQAIDFPTALQYIRENNLDAKAIFVILLIPLSKERPFIIHWHADRSGTATEAVYSMFLEFRKVIQREYKDIFELYGAAADADPQYRSAHEIFFSHWKEIMKQQSNHLMSAIPNIQKELMFSPDCSHLSKRLRYRLLSDSTKRFIFDNESQFFSETLIDFLDGNPDWYEFNSSRVTKMDDDCVHNFFTPKYMKQIFEKTKYQYIEVLLPGLILNIVMYDNTISRKSRIHALLIGFYFMFYLFHILNSHAQLEEIPDSNSQCPRSEYIWLPDQIKDYLNCAVQMIKILSEVVGEFSMSRFGTLDVEHLFSLVRRLCFGEESEIRSKEVIKEIITMRYFDQHPVTKRSHSSFPIAQVEATLPNLTVNDDITCMAIAQKLLYMAEGPNVLNIIPEADLKIQASPILIEDEYVATFLQMIDSWDLHYKYVNHNTTAGSVNDAYRPNSRILNRIESNSKVSHSHND